MLMRDGAVDRVVFLAAMMVQLILIVRVLALRDRPRERIGRMLVIEDMLYAVHEHDIALIGQYGTERHTEHDERAEIGTAPQADQENPVWLADRQGYPYRGDGTIPSATLRNARK